MSDEEEKQLATQENEWSVDRVLRQMDVVRECMKRAMKPDVHYGVIPGTEKPTIYKAGCELLCLMFRFDPEYEIVERTETPEYVGLTVKCTLFHIPTGRRIASGLGSCNSKEARFARAKARKCPKCGKDTIFPSKQKDNPGYFCWKKKGGCGVNFAGNAAKPIEEQDTRPADPSEFHNQITKQATIRALRSAILNATGASEIFTQDMEDEENTDPQEWEEPNGKVVLHRKVDPARVDQEAYDAARLASAMEDGDGWEPDGVEVVGSDGRRDTQRKIDPAQVKQIHILATACKLTDEEYRDTLMKRWGVKSSKEMGFTQAKECIERLEQYRQARQRAAKEIGEFLDDQPGEKNENVD